VKSGDEDIARRDRWTSFPSLGKPANNTLRDLTWANPNIRRMSQRISKYTWACREMKTNLQSTESETNADLYNTVRLMSTKVSRLLQTAEISYGAPRSWQRRDSVTGPAGVKLLARKGCSKNP